MTVPRLPFIRPHFEPAPVQRIGHQQLGVKVTDSMKRAMARQAEADAVDVRLEGDLARGDLEDHSLAFGEMGPRRLDRTRSR